MPKNGDTVRFSIGGALGSREMGEAAFEAHEANAEGEVKASADVSVYWFHAPFMILRHGGASYTFDQTRSILEPTGGHVMDMTAQIMMEPPGLSCDVLPLRFLSVGVVQNSVAPSPYAAVWDTPYWNNPIAGDSVAITTQYKLTQSLRSTADDVVRGGNGPTYSAPASVCEGESRTNDNPRFPTTPTYTIDTVTNGGVPTTVTYTHLRSMNINAEFLDWCVLYNSVIGATNFQQATSPLVESSWRLNVGSGAAQQTPQIDPQQSRPVTHRPLVLTTNSLEFANNANIATPSPHGPSATLRE